MRIRASCTKPESAQAHLDAHIAKDRRDEGKSDKAKSGAMSVSTRIVDEGWVSSCIDKFIGHGACISRAAQSAVMSGIPSLANPGMENSAAKDPVVDLLGYVVRRHLVNRSFRARLDDSLRNPLDGPSNVELMRIWGLIIVMLGEKQLFRSYDKSLLNAMLALCQRAFTHSYAEMRLQAFDSWRYLIWTVGVNVPKLLSSRLDLIMAPLLYW